MPNRPNIEHVMTFLKVIELQSFSQAADALAISKSVVSKHVTLLEQCLNTQLLLRSTRKLTLTDAGETFYQHAKKIPDQIAAAQDALFPFQANPHGTLKIVAPQNFSFSLKKKVVPEYLARYPDVELQIEFAANLENINLDNFDLMIAWKLSHEQFPDYNLKSKLLLNVPVGLFATKEYLEKNGYPKEPNDLINHNCISIASRPWPFRTKQGETQYLPMKCNLATTDDLLVHSAVCHDLGITYSVRQLFQEELSNGTVMQIMQGYTQFYLEVFAFYHPISYLPPKTKVFIELMNEYYLEIRQNIEV